MQERQQPLIAWSIASYRDNQLLPTLQSGIYHAHFASRLFPVVCWQGDLKAPCCSCSPRYVTACSLSASQKHSHHSRISAVTCASPISPSFAGALSHTSSKHDDTECAALTSPVAASDPFSLYTIEDTEAFLPSCAVAPAPGASGSCATAHDAAPDTVQLSSDSPVLSMPSRHNSVSPSSSRASQPHVYTEELKVQNPHHHGYTLDAANRTEKTEAGGASCACWCHALATAPDSSGHTVLPRQQHSSVFGNDTCSALTQMCIQQRSKSWAMTETEDAGTLSNAPPSLSAEKICTDARDCSGINTAQQTVKKRQLAKEQEQRRKTETGEMSSLIIAPAAASTSLPLAPGAASASTDTNESPGAPESRCLPASRCLLAASGRAAPGAAAVALRGAALAAGAARGPRRSNSHGYRSEAVAAALNSYDEEATHEKNVLMPVVSSRAPRRWTSEAHASARQAGLFRDPRGGRCREITSAGSNLSTEARDSNHRKEGRDAERRNSVFSKRRFHACRRSGRNDGRCCGSPAASSTKKGAIGVHKRLSTEEVYHVIDTERQEVSPSSAQETATFVNPEAFSLLEMYLVRWAKSSAQQHKTKTSGCGCAVCIIMASRRERLSPCRLKKNQSFWDSYREVGNNSSEDRRSEGGRIQACSPSSDRHVIGINSNSLHFERGNSFDRPQNSVRNCSQDHVTNSNAHCPPWGNKGGKAFSPQTYAKKSKLCSKHSVRNTQCSHENSVAPTPCPLAARTPLTSSSFRELPPRSMPTTPTAAAASSPCSSLADLLPCDIETLSVKKSSVSYLPRGGPYSSSRSGVHAAPDRMPSRITSSAAAANPAVHPSQKKSNAPPSVEGAVGSEEGDRSCLAETAVTFLENQPVKILQHLLPEWVKQQLCAGVEEDHSNQDNPESCVNLLCVKPRVTARFHLLSLVVPCMSLTESMSMAERGRARERQEKKMCRVRNTSCAAQDTPWGSSAQQPSNCLVDGLRESSSGTCSAKKYYCTCSGTVCRRKDYIRSRHRCNNSSLHDYHEKNFIRFPSSDVRCSEKNSSSKLPCLSSTSTICNNDNKTCDLSSSPCLARCSVIKEDSSFSKAHEASANVSDSIASCCSSPARSCSQNKNSSPRRKVARSVASRKDCGDEIYEGEKLLQLAVMDLEGPCTFEEEDRLTPSVIAGRTLRFRFVFVDWRDSRGPCFARYLCEQVLPFASTSKCRARKEMLLLQTDSHMRFAPHYDCFLVRQLLLAAAAAEQHSSNTSLVDSRETRFSVFPPKKQKRRSGGRRTVEEETAGAGEAEHPSAASTAKDGEIQVGQRASGVQEEDEKIWREDQRRIQRQSQLRAFQEHETATFEEKKEEAAARKERDIPTQTRKAASVSNGEAFGDKEEASAQTGNVNARPWSEKLNPSISLHQRQGWRRHCYKKSVSYLSCCAACGSCCDCLCSSCSCCCIRAHQGRYSYSEMSLKKRLYWPRKHLSSASPRKKRQKYKHRRLHYNRGKLLVRFLHKPLRPYPTGKMMVRRIAEKQMSRFQNKFVFPMYNGKRSKAQDERRKSRRARQRQEQLTDVSAHRQMPRKRQQKRVMQMISSLPRVLLTAYPPGYTEGMPYYAWPKTLGSVDGSSQYQADIHREAPATEQASSQYVKQTLSNAAASTSFCSPPLLPPVLLCAARFDEKGILRTTGRVLRVHASKRGEGNQMLLMQQYQHELHTGKMSSWQQRPIKETRETRAEHRQVETHRTWMQKQDLLQCKKSEEKLSSEHDFSKEQELAQTRRRYREMEEAQKRQVDVQKREKQTAGLRRGSECLQLLRDEKSKPLKTFQKEKSVEMLSRRAWLTSADAGSLCEQEISSIQQSCCCCCDERALWKERQEEVDNAEEGECYQSVRSSLFWAAGFSFGPARVVREVGYDSKLPYIFFGEEITMAMRLFTHGWRLFSPAASVVFHLWNRRYRPFFRQDVHQLHLNNSSSNRSKNNSDRAPCANSSSNSHNNGSNNSDTDSMARSNSGGISRSQSCTRNEGRQCWLKPITAMWQESESADRNQSRIHVPFSPLEEQQQPESDTLALSSCQTNISPAVIREPDDSGSAIKVWSTESNASPQQSEASPCTRDRYSLARNPNSTACMQATSPASSSEFQSLKWAGAAEAAASSAPASGLGHLEGRKEPHSSPTDDAGPGYEEPIHARRHGNRREGGNINRLLSSEGPCANAQENVCCSEAAVRQDSQKSPVSALALQQHEYGGCKRTGEWRQLKPTAERYTSGDVLEIRMQTKENPSHLFALERKMKGRRTDDENASQERTGKRKNQTSLVQMCCCHMCCSRAAAERRMRNVFAADSRVRSRYELQELGMGNKRSPQDFWKTAGIDWHSRSISLHALRGGLTHEQAFEGAGPTAAAALNLVLQLLTEDGDQSLAKADRERCSNILQ